MNQFNQKFNVISQKLQSKGGRKFVSKSKQKSQTKVSSFVSQSYNESFQNQNDTSKHSKSFVEETNSSD